VSRVVESRRGAKTKSNVTAGTRQIDFAREAGDFIGNDSASDRGVARGETLLNLATKKVFHVSGFSEVRESEKNGAVR
jgi:hypothetical protein